ncbi:Mn-dependent transcriptional regulator MntR [Nonlabens tegetincola]|uniref:Mn-dependent transcriptional regulator MntR n=1 Tax=Nonlabens tegetincola TaxID=323273 RepID=A0A090QKS0_9FLAO|nr:Mn-dependent transcriptional regulator MntR [Nonlabens tegetincola]
MHSVSEENYIKAIYHLQKGKDLVATNDIAARMDTKASSVTDMLKKLADKNLAQYVPYKDLDLPRMVLSVLFKLSGNTVYGNCF